MLDEKSRKLINGAVKEEEILNMNISSELFSVEPLCGSLLKSITTPQMSNRSSTDGRQTQIWMGYTFSRRKAGSSIASWPISRLGDTERPTWSGLHVRRRQHRNPSRLARLTLGHSSRSSATIAT